MKKIVFTVLLVFLALVPVFAKDLSIGLEAGYPASGIVVDYTLDNKTDVYGVLGFNYNKAVQLIVGGQYLFTKIDAGNGIAVKGGVQIIPRFFFSANSFNLAALGTVSLGYDFSENFSSYLRLGAGVGIAVSENFKVGFNYSGALGLTYKF